MNDFVSNVKTVLKNASSMSLENHVKTSDIRRISARVFKEIRRQVKGLCLFEFSCSKLR